MMKEILKANTIAPKASNNHPLPPSVKEKIYFGRSIKKNIVTPYGKKLRLAAIAESGRVPGVRANSPDLALGALIRGMQQSRARVISFALQDAIKFSNQVTYNYITSKQNDLPPSTLTVALLDQNQLHIATVGESEVFLLKNGHFKWLQTKSSISALEKKRLIGAGPNVTPRNLSLSASTALDTGFNGIKLNREDKVMLCSSKAIGNLIETNPKYFDEIKRLIQEINPNNYAAAIEDWVKKLKLSIELPSMPPLLVLFPEESSALNQVAADPSQRNEVPSNNGMSASNEEVAPTVRPETIEIQKKEGQSPRRTEINETGKTHHDLGLAAAEAEATDHDTEDENREQGEIKRSLYANGVKPAELTPTLNSAEVNHFSPETSILYDNIEMTRQSPVQTALAAFPLIIDTAGESENLEVSPPPNSRLTSVQIFFSILIVITLTILISVIFSVMWSEFS